MESDKPEIFQTNVIPNPVNIPAIAPCRVTFSQYSVKSINGPKLAPNPDHANKTNQKITRFSPSAINIAPKPSKKTVNLLINNIFSFVKDWFSILEKISCATVEAATKIWAETVDMIADKTPVNTIAVKNIGKSCSAAFGNKYSGSSKPGNKTWPQIPNKMDEEYMSSPHPRAIHVPF